MRVDQQVVLQIVAETLDLPQEELAPISNSEDFSQWDSLGHLRVCMAIEEHFGVTIKMSDIPELDSVPKLLAYLEG